MKTLVILNPNSQGGATGRMADQLAAVISNHVGDVDLALTDRPTHASEMAERAAKDGRETVIAVGGDGTIHEVVHGLMQGRVEGIPCPKLGIVGQGTGGDFRKTLGLEHRLDRYCQAIAAGRTRLVDVGRTEYVDNTGQPASGHFINILSVGMGGLVDRYVADSKLPLGGTVAYLAASARALLECEVGILECVFHHGDERREVEVATRMLAICNGQYFGGGMQVAPMAEPDDGAFDIVSLGAAPRLNFALGTMSIYDGKHIDKPGTELFRGDKIELALKNPGVSDKFLLDVDGEPLGKLPLKVELVRGAIEVFVDNA